MDKSRAIAGLVLRREGTHCPRKRGAASSPCMRLTGITNAMIYGITAFAGFEAAAGEEARNTPRSVPEVYGSKKRG
jgi:hypothetical protein